MKKTYTAAVITVSDKGAAGERPDTSGPEICRILSENGYDVIRTAVVPDEKEQIRKALLECTDDRKCALVVTTGGTGFSQRDVTPEATREILDRQTPGLPERMRAESMKITPHGCLSRGMAGIRDRSLIVNLPGSEKAARENLEAVIGPIGHGLKMLFSEGSSDHEEHGDHTGGGGRPQGEFTHFNEQGRAKMVNVGEKPETERTAEAAVRVLVSPETFSLIRSGGIRKGDVLTVAQIAGIMGAKRTPELIPMCHPVLLDGVDLDLSLNEQEYAVEIRATVRCTGRTGVEMEALTAASAAALTVYDMCKAVQRDMVITDLHLVKKTGGIHGDYSAEERE